MAISYRTQSGNQSLEEEDTPEGSRLDGNIGRLRSPEQEVLDKVRLGEVHEAMGVLTDLQRQVLNLRFAADLSIAEVASVMNRKEGAVKALQFSALRSLRRATSLQEAGSHGR